MEDGYVGDEQMMEGWIDGRYSLPFSGALYHLYNMYVFDLLTPSQCLNVFPPSLWPVLPGPAGPESHAAAFQRQSFFLSETP